MTEPTANFIVSQSLAELLAAGPSWTLKERLVLADRLALAVQALHVQGRTHRALDAATVTVDERLRPQLGPPAGPRRFGAEQSNPEFCPPELALDTAVELPAEIEAATAILREQGLAVDPRRVDVYQFGVLLCQLLTGESLLSYRYSTSVKAKVPPLARAVLDRCLGEGPAPPLSDCEGLIDALEELLPQCADESPPSVRETPARGSSVDFLAETPPQGSAVAAPAERPAFEELPFQRLGHFQVVQRIGSGGMGDVYKGYDATLDRYVAIKVLPAVLARDEDFVRRFHAEATAVAKLAHPNVVPIHFIGQDAGHHFFAMQFIEGESLAQLLARQPRLPLEQALPIVEQCLAGLEAAHARELIHRDIKPGNVLLDQASKRAVLVDFGLVRRLGASAQMTATGVVMGTVDYIAPEQARGQPVDGRADIYSLGVMFYQLLAGRLPFNAESPTAMIFQHAYEEPFPLEQAAAEVPSAVIEIVARMMAKDPAQRYPDCAAVLAELRTFRERGAVQPSPPAPLPEGEGSHHVPLSLRERAGVRAFSPDSGADLSPALLSLPADTPLQRAKDWAATMFRRHAPEYLKELQNTTQQVDGGVAEYERRSKRLAGLLEEARQIAADLSSQITSEEEAARQLAAAVAAAADPDDLLAKKHACEENLEASRAQYAEQQGRVEQLELELSKATATLARLRSQRDLLKARLQAVDVQRRCDGDRPPAAKRRPILVAAMAILGVFAGVLAVKAIIQPKFRGDTGVVESEMDVEQSAISVPPGNFVATPPPAIAPFDAAAARQLQQQWARHLGVPVEVSNSIGMKFVLIPPGKFMMGSPKELIEEELKTPNIEGWYKVHLSREGPRHRVRITKPFYLGVYDVTQGEYERVMGTNPSEFSATGKHKDQVAGQDTKRFPVESVSWDDAVEFCRKLSVSPAEKAAGRTYRLPSEAQWEYACRAGSTGRYSFSPGSKAIPKESDENALTDYGWFTGNSGRMTHVVGGKRANPWGLYDMHGNVLQWCQDSCQDWYTEDYYRETDGAENPLGPKAGSNRVNRGGGWFCFAERCRSAYRSGDSPGSRSDSLGFRVSLIPADK